MINIIREIRFSKYFPFVVNKDSLKHFQANFKLDPSIVQIQNDEGEWVSLDTIIDKEKGLKYTVDIKKVSGGKRVPVNRGNIIDEIKVFVHVVTFSNDFTTMRNLKGNFGIMVFSTVARILIEFQKRYSTQFQCFTFTPAHPKLEGVYEILARESEKQGDLVYINSNIGRSSKKWYLLNKKLWKKYTQIKGV